MGVMDCQSSAEKDMASLSGEEASGGGVVRRPLREHLAGGVGPPLREPAAHASGIAVREDEGSADGLVIPANADDGRGRHGGARIWPILPDHKRALRLLSACVGSWRRTRTTRREAWNSDAWDARGT